MADAAGSTSSREKANFKVAFGPRTFFSFPSVARSIFASVAVRSKVIEKLQGNCMADTKMGGVLSRSVPSYLVLQEGHHHGRYSHDGAVGTQPARGNSAALVLPQPFPRHPRTAGLPAIHDSVRRRANRTSPHGDHVALGGRSIDCPRTTAEISRSLPSSLARKDVTG
jgi:hypothetical protein